MSHFFAYLSRMKYIKRWGLMRNTRDENIQEHSLQVAMIAHSLAVIRNRCFNGDTDPQKVLLLAVYHEASEVITGDLATPIKYFNPEIKTAYKAIEAVANQRLFSMLPDELKADYSQVFFPAEEDEDLWQLVKAADKICAYLKCIEELKAGNQEFIKAEKSIIRDLNSLNMPEVKYFMERFVPSFSLTLDELN
ncbi:MAG TPA: 5'-deoxynucleotidase [Candidatus Atribacteria bacterium]|nr:5'-deoxynucleotidase [Candidatus Atribacteria bacterium]HPT77684.1 5'-deoxynucleotidase [Candidatus Atribacteria bacterium]